MTETEYKKKQAQDTNQLKKAFDAGYRKGRKEGIDEMREVIEQGPQLIRKDVERTFVAMIPVEYLLIKIARLKEQGV